MHSSQSWDFYTPSPSFSPPKSGQCREIVSLLPLGSVISGGDSWNYCSHFATEPKYLKKVSKMKQSALELTLLIGLLFCKIIHFLIVSPLWMWLLTAKGWANYGLKNKSIHGADTQLVESRLNFISSLNNLDWMKTDLRNRSLIWFKLTKNGKLIPVIWEKFQDYSGTLRPHGKNPFNPGFLESTWLCFLCSWASLEYQHLGFYMTCRKAQVSGDHWHSLTIAF